MTSVLFISHTVQGMWAWFQRAVQPAHAHPDNPQSTSEVQVSNERVQGSLPQPIKTERALEESAQERLENTVCLCLCLSLSPSFSFFLPLLHTSYLRGVNMILSPSFSQASEMKATEVNSASASGTTSADSTSPLANSAPPSASQTSTTGSTVKMTGSRKAK